MPEPLQIVQLTVENIKRVKALTIRGSDVVVLTGRNAQGKTSVLDSIWLALGGGTAKRDTKITSPIREGETEARVQIDLGELVVTRYWKSGADDVTTSLVVEGADGSRFPSPQAVLDALIGHAGFDPLAFTRLSDRDQVAALAERVELPFDPMVYDVETTRLFDERTGVSRDVKKAEAALEAMPRYPNSGTVKVDIGTLIAERDALMLSRTERATLRTWISDTIDEHLRRLAQLKDAEDRVTNLRDEAARLAADAATEQSRLDGKPEPDWTRLDIIDEALKDVGAANEQIDANARAATFRDHLAGLRSQEDGLTAQIDQRRNDKKAALAAAVFPVDDLGFDDGVVIYKGVPFKQASAAEQVEVSTGIAMAGNPRLRVITIRDASLLDSEHMQVIESMAAAKGYQLWLERVDESGKMGVVIEDGQVQS